MKKSTLITTIAMIVVVVVALSTATYAWFSSSAVSTATASFSTSATGDWSITSGSIDNPLAAGTAGWILAPEATDSITYTNTLNNALWAPYAQITTAFTSSKPDATLTGLASFVSCQNAPTNTAGTNSTVKVKHDGTSGTEGAVDYVAPLLIRLGNVSGAEKTLQMNVTVNALNAGTNNSMYAGAAIRFYISEYQNGDTVTAANTYTSGYNVSDASSIEYDQEITKGTPQPMTTGLGITLANYSAANIADNYKKAAAADAALGIATNDYVRTYTFDMGTYAAAGYSNIVIYCWVDGWVAGKSAGGAAFSVTFGFTSKTA